MSQIKGGQKGPQDVIDKINSVSDEQDRLGYVSETISLIDLIELMLNSWKQLYAGKNIGQSSIGELRDSFLFMKGTCLGLIEATNLAHVCVSQQRLSDIEAGSFDPLFEEINENLDVI